MKKLITRLLLAVSLSAAFATQLNALSITPSFGDPVGPPITRWSGNDNSNLSAAEIAAIVGVSPLTEVYKKDNTEGGTFASSYESSFSDSTGLIEYISGPTIDSAKVFLYVKDGSQIPAFYIFDISGWNRTDDLVLSGFWEGVQGAISHLTLLGGDGPDTQTGVPDGGTTIALLGLALAGLGLARRYIA